jgi:hypothetical protein
MAAMLIRTAETPNPATRKFLPGQAVMETGTRDFPDADSAAASPLAEALFDSGMVEGVFFGRDFISVTAWPGRNLRVAGFGVSAVLISMAAMWPFTPFPAREG